MASNMEFVEYVCGQLDSAGDITWKRMFGDYGIYCNAKIIGLVCDNQFFLKKTKAGAELMPELEEGEPYRGAKPYFIMENLENREQLRKLVETTFTELPEPKPKKSRKKEKNA